jgi:hypothetical protein
MGWSIYTSGNRDCIHQRARFELSGCVKNNGVQRPCALTLSTRYSALVLITFLSRQRGRSQLGALAPVTKPGLKRLETVNWVPDWVYLNLHMRKVTLVIREGTCAPLEESAWFS